MAKHLGRYHASVPAGHAGAFPGSLACVDRMGLLPEQLLYVGDDPHNDVVGPSEAGWHAAWINRHGGEWPETLGGSHSPLHTFGDLNAFADWLLEKA